jgi:tripartite-type tricarboxylate transporter receptor subunit TctC
MSVVVKDDSKYKTLGDLVAAAKAEPGKITYGTGGAGTTPHFVSEALGIASGVQLHAHPVQGRGEATMGMLSGTIDFQVASTPA